ncbi:MAG: archaeal proteasome endopeptidase complex subunit beta [Aigarchaeota archaeon]|nr:archaeal proteasome endopeptidase complex subunit beta [Aigarchaeota archaeon]MDW8092515.1 archaeal proteasome endopeptidase complex subunit beta [Nitrososphaerota archaeon]
MHIRFFDDAQSKEDQLRSRLLKTGTTTIGFIARDFVVFATDKRATAGFYIAHRNTRKVHQIAPHAAITIAGRVADAQSLIDVLRANARYYQIAWRKTIEIKTLATMTSNFLFGNKYFPFQAQFILGGVDTYGPHLFNIDLFGSLTEERMLATGSGSPIALGVLESEYREDLSLDEAIKLAYKAVAAAIRRDIGSGDNIDVAYISPATMFRELSSNEKRPLFENFVRPFLPS